MNDFYTVSLVLSSINFNIIVKVDVIIIYCVFGYIVAVAAIIGTNLLFLS